MNTLLIVFDADRLVSPLFRTVIERSFPLNWHQLPGKYIVRTPLTSAELRDMLKVTLDERDELLIVTLRPKAWAWRGNTDAGVAWLRDNA